MPKGKTRHHPTIGKRPYFCNKTPYKQLQGRREEIRRDIKRQMKEKGVIGDKIPFTWEWRHEEKFGTVTGFTKSDARSKIKLILNISKKKPLPHNVQIRKVEFNEPSA